MLFVICLPIGEQVHTSGSSSNTVSSFIYTSIFIAIICIMSSLITDLIFLSLGIKENE